MTREIRILLTDEVPIVFFDGVPTKTNLSIYYDRSGPPLTVRSLQLKVVKPSDRGVDR